MKTDLFVLQPERLNSSTPLKGKLTNCHSSGCERPFSVQKVPHSNLILLVVDTLCPCGSKQLDIGPQETVPGPTGKCIEQTSPQLGIWNFNLIINFQFDAGTCNNRRLLKDRLPRKRAAKCINYHPEEIEIQQCGAATSLFSGSLLLLNVIIMLQAWTLTA